MCRDQMVVRSDVVRSDGGGQVSKERQDEQGCELASDAGVRTVLESLSGDGGCSAWGFGACSGGGLHDLWGMPGVCLVALDRS
mmetsp:Transcript_45761/g.91302  ORF Transcript_45761/g.91302 Transcript_45761/m.91302 type:complete len:83 (+) Transcript_45761:1157-1405(+)